MNRSVGCLGWWHRAGASRWHVVGVWALCALAGCAQGFDPPEAPGQAPSGDDPMPMAGNGNAGTPSAPAAGNSGAAGAVPAGDTCTMGQSESCQCADGSAGTRLCRFDSSSPTRGRFSECTSCAPAMAGNGAGTGNAAGNGSAGSGGSGTNSGSGGSGSAGRGGAGGSGGSSGGAGSGGSGGSSSNMDEAWCVFVPIPLPGLCN